MDANVFHLWDENDVLVDRVANRTAHPLLGSHSQILSQVSDFVYFSVVPMFFLNLTIAALT